MSDFSVNPVTPVFRTSADDNSSGGFQKWTRGWPPLVPLNRKSPSTELCLPDSKINFGVKI
jgi:hypothetical protein